MLYAWGYVNVRCRTSQHALSFRVSGRGRSRIPALTPRGMGTYMKPAPPVIMMFFTSGRGSNLVVPVNTGASFQTPKSSKKFWRVPLTPVQLGSGLVQARVASRFTYHLRYHWYRLCEEPSCRLFRLKRLLKYPFRTREKVQKGAAQGVSLLLLLLLVWPSRGSFVRAPGDRRSRQARSEVVTTESKNCGDGSRATAIWRADCAGDRPNKVVTRACP